MLKFIWLLKVFQRPQNTKIIYIKMDLDFGKIGWIISFRSKKPPRIAVNLNN